MDFQKAKIFANYALRFPLIRHEASKSQNNRRGSEGKRRHFCLTEKSRATTCARPNAEKFKMRGCSTIENFRILHSARLLLRKMRGCHAGDFVAVNTVPVFFSFFAMVAGRTFFRALRKIDPDAITGNVIFWQNERVSHEFLFSLENFMSHEFMSRDLFRTKVQALIFSIDSVASTGDRLFRSSWSDRKSVV